MDLFESGAHSEHALKVYHTFNSLQSAIAYSLLNVATLLREQEREQMGHGVDITQWTPFTSWQN